MSRLGGSNAFRAAALGLALTIASAPAANDALAQQDKQLAAVPSKTQSKIIIEFGRGIEELDAKVTAAALIQDGCKDVVVRSGGPYKRFKVTAGDNQPTIHTDGDSAYLYGKEHCGL